MNLQFNLITFNEEWNEWEVDECDFDTVTNAFPNWTFGDGGAQDGVIIVPGWNPVAITPINPITGECIADFVEFALTNPEAPVNEAVWELTGNTTTLIGQFTNTNGFVALPPTV